MRFRRDGRRRGRKGSVRQEELTRNLLPRLALPLDRPAPPILTSIGNSQAKNAWLEIGFGGGEHLVWQAEQNPDVLMVGCEPFMDGVVKVLDAVTRLDLANVRLHADDARTVLRWLPAGSIDRAFILFPDPWPKMRHRKRRLVNSETIAELARVLGPGAELRLATDIGDYAAQMLEVVLASGAFEWQAAGASDWRQRPPDWPPTRYEGKAVRANSNNGRYHRVMPHNRATATCLSVG